MKIIIKISLILIISHLGIYPIYAQDNGKLFNDTLFFPAIMDVLDDYYSYYYQFPDSSKQVSRFVEDMLFADKDSSAYFLTPYSFNNYFIVQKTFAANVANVYMLDDSIHLRYYDLEEIIPIENMGFLVCEIDSLIGEFPGDYNGVLSRFSGGRFFDKKGRAVIITQELEEELKRLIVSLQEEYLLPESFSYRKYEYEDIEVPIQAVIAFDLKDGLRYYCTSKCVDYKLQFYKALEKSLKEFCINKKLSWIYFLLPDYYSVE